MNRLLGLSLAVGLSSLAGVLALAQGQASPEELVRQFDRDGDGKISKDEAPQRMRQRWEQIDTDGDGFVSLGELKARDARVAGQGGQAQAGARRGGGMGQAAAGFHSASAFSVITVGTGSPRYDSQRSGPSAMIQHQGRCYLVNMGNGTQARLSEMGVSMRQIDALLLTHHHVDHNEEFIPLFLFTRLAGARPEIVGPPGTRQLADFAREFYAEDLAYRLRRSGRTIEDFAPAAVREVKGGESFTLGGMKVTTAAVVHTIATVAYRFEAQGQSIVISGDTSYAPGLVELARGADVLVIDSGGSIVRAGQGERGGKPMAGRGARSGAGADAQKAHASLQEVADMARRSGARKLVLTHIAPGEVDEQATVRGLAQTYKGEVLVGRDLLEVAPGGATDAPTTTAPAVPPTAAPAKPAPLSAAGTVTPTETVEPISAVAAGGVSRGTARVYVRAGAAGAMNGKGWGSAFASVQAGIDAAQRQGGGEVWVAKGTYKPTAGSDRGVSIQLRPGVDVYGGFAGGETRLDQRDWNKNVTILSGDIGRAGVATDNSYHVVSGADDAVLDGFTIANGYGLGGAGRPGGAMPGGMPGGGGFPGGGMRGDGPPMGEGGPGASLGGTAADSFPQPWVFARRMGSDVAASPFGRPPARADSAETGDLPAIDAPWVFADYTAANGAAVPPEDASLEDMQPAGPPDGPPGDGPFDGPPGGMPGGRMGGPGGGMGGGPGGGMGGGPGGGIHTSPQAILAGASPGSGAGMVNFQCAPTVRNCTFRDNVAGKGGAMYNMTSRSFPPRRDGASPAPTVIDCCFLNNSARGRGGAVANDLGTSPTFRGCTFVGNSCDAKGGAVYNDFGCSPILVNCLFVQNRALSAAAIGNDGASSPLIVHCTFTGNHAREEGAGLYQGTGPANNPVVVGCILWGDRCDAGPAEVFNWHDNDPQISLSCVQMSQAGMPALPGGVYPGQGNLDVDPQFADPAGGDYRPRPGSPCKAIGYTAPASDEYVRKCDTRKPVQMGPHPGPPAEGAATPRVAEGSRVVLYVNAAQSGADGQTRPDAASTDGRSWAAAFSSLQDALAAAADKPAEIWVAAGTYKPTAATDRAASFCLREGVELYGGFKGREKNRSDRDWNANVTVLSGDIGKASDAGDNCYHVLIGADGAVLDGFVVRDGNADARTYDAKGGGMVNYLRSPQTGPMGAATGFSPVVRNCTFTRNRAIEGGAVYNYDRGSPQFVNCRFAGNWAQWGGAMVDRVGVESTLTNCIFEKNVARWRGGAIYFDYGSRPAVTNCRFTANRSDCHGGAVATISRASQLENTMAFFSRCTFAGNIAKLRGGAIYNFDSGIIGLDACTFSDNRAGAGGAIANDSRSRAIVVDCRFNGNHADTGPADIASDETSSVSRERADLEQ